jgi:4-diphosphocytidyl-2-C-methyl-D-erythritol kinase
MITFPNAKINIGLRIVRKRENGYHDLETFFQPIAIEDALEINEAIGHEPTSMSQSGIPVLGNVQDNLCFKAWQLLKSRYPGIPEVRIHLHKVIPMGAGLGGGSSDGAFTLHSINALFELGITIPHLAQLALELGSDCPFFIHNTPCFAMGRGEQLTPKRIDLSGHELVVIHPGIHTSTRQAFHGIMASSEGPALIELLDLPINQWKGVVVNDFEKTIFAAEPRIAAIRDMLYEKGAEYASLTGSGSSVYGMFRKGISPEITAEKDWKVFRPAFL